MKIVLLKDIAGVGRRNEVKNVSDGYALNMLIPNKLAVVGTPSAIAHAARLKAEQEGERKLQENLLLKNFSSLEGVEIELTEKANEKGHLFASVHTSTIASELKKQKGIDVLPDFLHVEKPIKEIGAHTITVKAHDKTGTFSLVIKAL